MEGPDPMTDLIWIFKPIHISLLIFIDSLGEILAL
jgi:hypothetical protein